MKRRLFFKSLVTLAVAPSILSKIDFSPRVSTVQNSKSTNNLVSELQLLTPKYYRQYLEKYGGENFTEFINVIQNER